MRTICAWCGIEMDAGADDADASGHISHGICQGCYQKEVVKLAALKAVQAVQTVKTAEAVQAERDQKSASVAVASHSSPPLA